MTTPTPKTGRALMAFLAEGPYQTTEARYDSEALAAAFVEAYGGPKGAEYLGELEHCEIRLDALWPGWRVKAPFAHLAPDTIADIKLPLSRRRQLLLGAGEYGLRIVWRGDQPLAVSIKPRAKHVVPPEPTWYEPNYSRPHLAASTGLALPVIEAAMDAFDRGCGVNARDWCLKWAAEHSKTEATDADQG